MLSLLGILVSCDKNEGVSPEKLLNKFRVKEIKGHNTLWGDFKMSIEYQNNLVDKAFVINSENDTVGRLTPTAVMTKKLTLSPDEIAALPEGSAIPWKWQIVYSINKSLKKETITRIKYLDDENEVSVIDTYLYEYEDSLAIHPKIIKWRHLGDEKEGGELGRMIYNYEDNRIATGEYSIYQVNFWEVSRYWKYEYNGENLVAVEEKSADGRLIMDLRFTYGDKRLIVAGKINGITQEVTYIFNAEGEIIRIDEGNGNYMEMQYESGHGNISEFVPEFEKLQGKPYVK